MGTDAGKMGWMKKSMYGTRDAASNWERDCREHVMNWGISTWTQLEQSVSPQRNSSIGFDTRGRFRAHRADKETDGVRKENDKCLSHQSEDHQVWIAEEHQHAVQEVALGKASELFISMIPDTLDFAKDFGLEHGNSVQTLATRGVMEEEESEPMSQVQHQQCRSQVAKMFVSQSGPSRHNIHRERIVPEDVESQPAESCQIEKACQGSET